MHRSGLELSETIESLASQYPLAIYILLSENPVFFYASQTDDDDGARSSDLCRRVRQHLERHAEFLPERLLFFPASRLRFSCCFAAGACMLPRWPGLRDYVCLCMLPSSEGRRKDST